jgi:molybdopterin converting factor small subunit
MKGRITMKDHKIDLQMFATLEEILETHKETLGEEGESVKTQFTGINAKLSELGYDVLINDKQNQEFIPKGRLNEVAGQRDQFKEQVEELNTNLQKMKEQAKGNEELQTQLQGMMDKNQDLLSELEKTKLNAELMLAASEAVNPKDILAFVNMDNVKVTTKGEMVGVAEEIKRIKEEKPYLFKAPSTKKGGSDTSGDDDPNKGKFGMNAFIRGAAR